CPCRHGPRARRSSRDRVGCRETCRCLHPEAPAAGSGTTRRAPCCRDATAPSTRGAELSNRRRLDPRTSIVRLEASSLLRRTVSQQLQDDQCSWKLVLSTGARKRIIELAAQPRACQSPVALYRSKRDAE